MKEKVCTKILIARRVRWVKPIIEQLCNEFGLQRPTKVSVMSNYFGRPESTFGRFKYTSAHSTNGYEITVRVCEYDDKMELNPRSKEDVMQTICHELAHSRHYEHNSRHFSLTRELFARSKELIGEQ